MDYDSGTIFGSAGSKDVKNCGQMPDNFDAQTRTAFPLMLPKLNMLPGASQCDSAPAPAYMAPVRDRRPHRRGLVRLRMLSMRILVCKRSTPDALQDYALRDKESLLVLPS